ncbi:MAG TPA: hypothetical protein VGI45_25110 [Terracidiphilus sp.]|jgi:hypothetical protein
MALLILFAATAVRMAWVAHVIRFACEFSAKSSFGDEEIGNIATNLAEGRGFSSPFSFDSIPTAWECPLVPAVYAGIIRLEGGPTGKAARAAVWLQSVIGGIAACLQWLVIRRLMERNPGLFREWLSLVVAVVVCFWPESVTSVANRWYYVWQDAALALLVLLVMQWWEQPVIKRGALVGLCGGVIGLINITPIPIVLGVILIPAVKLRRQTQVLRSAGIAAFCFAIVITPWIIRNTIVFHTPMALRSNGGFELFQGNNAIECIRQPDHAPHPGVDRAEFQMYMEMGEIQYSRYSFHRAIVFMRAHPSLTARRILDRIYISWLTDITDRWISPGQRPWWTLSRAQITRSIFTMALILASFATLIWGIVSRRFRLLPHASLFVLLFIFLPLPHYFTLADMEYMTTLRFWVAIVALCMAALRVNASSAAATNNPMVRAI